MIDSPLNSTLPHPNHQIHKIHYHNIRGMSKDKFEYHSSKLIHQDGPDIIVLSETWFINHKALQKNPTFKESTPKPDIPTGKTNRFMNGITLLARPGIKERITVNSTDLFYIHFTLDTINYLAVYFPPSLEDGGLEIFLSQIDRPVDVLIGDINVVWVTPGNQEANHTETRGRKAIINKFLARKQLFHQAPALIGIAKQGKDHTFVSTRVTCTEYSQYNAPDTVYEFFDHPILDVSCSSVRSEDTDPMSNDEPQYRYNLNSLRYKKVQRKFQKNYADNSSTFDDRFTSFRLDQAPQLKQAHLDSINSTIVGSIRNACDIVLHKYDVQAMKNKPDRLLDTMVDSHIPEDILRGFKRMLSRGKASKKFIARDPDKTPVEEAPAYFSSLYTFDDEHKRNKFKGTPPPLPSDETESEELSEAFSIARIKKFIHQYSSNKSGGPDGIHIEMLKKLDKNCPLLHHLSFLLTRSARLGLVPSEWKKSSICCIPKKDSSRLISDSRGIALTQIFRRIFEGLLLRQWDSSTADQDSSWNKVLNVQGGFQKKMNTYPHIVVTHDLHKLGRDAIVFIDLKAAYDRVPISKIISILEEREAPKRVISLVYSLFSECSSNVIVNQEVSADFGKECGLFQGSLLSPLLFNVFIDVLAKRLQKERDEGCYPEVTKDDKLAPFFLLYADDIQLNGRTLPELQKMLDILGTWCEEHNMLPGFKKCQWLHREGLEGDLFLSGEKLEKVESYTYLGVPMTFKGIDFEAYMPSLLKKASKLFGYLKSFSGFLPHAHRIYLVKSFVLSHLEYGLPLFAAWIDREERKDPQWKSLLATLTSFYDSCRTWAVGYNNPKDLMQHMTNIPSYGTLVKERTASIQEQIVGLSPSHPLSFLLSSIKTPKGDIKSRFKKQKLLMAKVTNSGIYKKFKEAKEETETLSLPTFLRNQREKLNIKSALVCYTLPSSVTTKTKTDAVFRIKDSQTRFNAIRWRRNKVGYADRVYDPDKKVKCSHCQVCRTRWNRNHVMSCPIVGQHQSISGTQWNQFQRERTLSRTKYPHAKHYTILDSLLNNSEFSTFQAVYNSIESSLERTISYAPIRIRISLRPPRT